MSFRPQQEVMDRFEKLIKVAGKEKEYKVIQTGCQGLCAKGPIVVIHPGAVFYEEVNPDKAEVIFREHVEGGNVASKYLLREENADGTNDEDFKFYNRQTRIALRNCGIIDPENIDEYIGRGGYEALGRSLTQMSPDDVIQVVLDSGLRGRGGAGFPTGKKWKLLAATEDRFRSTYAVTPTKETRVRSWIVPFWKVTRTACWKQWPLPDTQSAQIRVTSTFVQSIQSP